MELDPDFWLNVGRMAAIVAAIGLLFGAPIGFVVWRRTGRRAPAIVAGVTAALLGLLLVAWLYYTMVLCPTGAGCV